MNFGLCYVTMPGLVHRSPQPANQSSGSFAGCEGAFISCLQEDGVDSRQLSRYWNELSFAARRELLRIDKQSLFEHVRKNLYCSRCNGLLLEAFSRLATYSKNHQGVYLSHGKNACGCDEAHCDRREWSSDIQLEDDVRDPSVHPWGGLTVTRDGTLTLIDSFLDGQPLDVIQMVCGCARARERERELLYPDACGGGGRGWISQSIGSFGSSRGHNLKETCSLHTARISCDALVDFWSALGEETRRSLLRMKEEDFIARLMFRFESKRFCRDCRRNVLKELKELKELKRARKQPKCTRWFCSPDIAFRYEVSNTSVTVNWRECFGGDLGSIYQYFEWSLGTAEGNADIMGFEHVGLSEGARVDGLDLSQMSLFYITLRAWKHDGRCTEVSVKAHNLRGKQCVHRRLPVGNGQVTITKGDSIKRFFELAEEAEEEEDDDEMDKSGSEPENEGVRAQKHAKSPELAREFLLDAATIIFKEQVEKAFREGTARQNAHTIFVCLALNILEERIHVAYKEISTLEKQKQLLKEEEHEKWEEQQRRERKRLKEKEKKSRRKEKRKGRDCEKEKSKCDLQPACSTATDCDSGATSLLDENEEVHTDVEIKESRNILDDGMFNDSADAMQPSDFKSIEIPQCINFRHEASDHFDLSIPMDNFEEPNTVGDNSSFLPEKSNTSRRRIRPRKGPFMEVISRRFVRRSSITSLDASDGSQGCMKLSCTSVRETSEVVTEQVFLSTHKFRRGFVKSERNKKPNSLEGWNNGRLHQRQSGGVLHDSSKRTFYIKSKQNNGTGWVGKEGLSLKNSQRGSSVVLDNENFDQIGRFVSGSSQCSWQSIKGMLAGHAERELPEQDAVVDFEAISSNSSSESEKIIETDCKEDISAGGDALVSTHGYAAYSNINAASAGRCHPESLAFSKSASSSVVEALKPLGRVVAVSTEEDLDGDASPSSATSCVTDSTDGSTRCIMRTESSNFGFSCSSIEAPTTERPISNSAEQQVCMKEPIQGGVENASLGKGCDSAYKHDKRQAVRAVGRHTSSEYFAHSSAGNFLSYSHDYNCGKEQMRISVNPEVGLLDGTPHVCNTQSTVPLSLVPVSVMPVHMPQSFGFSWVPNQCLPQPVMNSGLLPVPHHPGNLYMDGFGPSRTGVQASLLPFPPPFQPVSHIMQFSCIPTAPMHQSFTQWSEQQLFYDEGTRAEPLLTRNALDETGLYIDSLMEEQSAAILKSPDAASATDPPSNDPLGFSLFHFGGLSTDERELSILSESKEATKEAFKPLDMPCGRAVQLEAAAVPKSSLPMQEYSLFAATPTSRFGFL